MTVSHDKNKEGNSVTSSMIRNAEPVALKRGQMPIMISGSEMLLLCYSGRVLVNSSPVKS